jgi:hypothetical protein
MARGPERSPTPRRPTAGRPCRLVRWSGVTARGDDGLDGPRGGDLERLEHGGGIAADRDGAAYRPATGT